MNLLDLLKPPVADATALPLVLPGVLPAALPRARPLPAFADALAQLQPAAAPPAGAGQPLPAIAQPLEAAEPPADEQELPALPALPPEGVAWLALPAPNPPAEPVAEAEALPAPTLAIRQDAAPPSAPALPPEVPAAAAARPLPPQPPLPAPAETATPAPRAMARPAPAAAAPREEIETTPAAARPAGLEGWLAAQLGEAEAAPATPLQTTLRLPEPQAAAEPGRAWRQPLLVALGDRLQLQIAARSEQAVIRLEPPLLGRIDIAIRHEGGELQVRMVASHAEVGRQLQQLTEPLRQDLLQRHSGEVSVQVGTPAEAARGGESAAGGRGASAQQQQQQAHQERRPGRGLAEEGEAGGFAAPR